MFKNIFMSQVIIIKNLLSDNNLLRENKVWELCLIVLMTVT